MIVKIKKYLRKKFSDSIYNFLRIINNPKTIFYSLVFLMKYIQNVPFKKKLFIVKQLYQIDFNIISPHTQYEMLSFILVMLKLAPEIKGNIVEAGCYKGISTAKFSLAANIIHRTLVVFDSFEGIPQNDENHYKSIFGRKVNFKKGDYCGTLDEVKNNVAKYGKIENCRFIKGWFDDTMPNFKEPIAAIYLDVDLALSTRTCLKFLFPLLSKGGTLFSQDGHLPLVLDVFNDEKFWLDEVGFKKPVIQGFGKNKLLKIVKES